MKLCLPLHPLSLKNEGKYKKEFFEKIYIDREVVQEAVSGACFFRVSATG